jgi:hypothetical protein
MYYLNISIFIKFVYKIINYNKKLKTISFFQSPLLPTQSEILSVIMPSKGEILCVLGCLANEAFLVSSYA